MSNETFFRMLSIAFLGAVALAFVPDSQADAIATAQLEAIDIEIQSVQEVQEINAGRFNPAVAGDIADYANAQETAREITEVSALTRLGL